MALTIVLRQRQLSKFNLSSIDLTCFDQPLQCDSVSDPAW